MPVALQSITVTASVPKRVTTDGHDSYPGAVKAELGDAAHHRTNRYLNNHLEQDHRGIKLSLIHILTLPTIYSV